jgi:hypothetical protein
VAGQVLSLSLDKDLLLSGSLEVVLKLVLGFYANHFILFVFLIVEDPSA